MTVPSTLSEVPALTPYIQYTATANQTVFPYPFPITQDADLVVSVNGVTQATDSTYSVSGVGNVTGGNVTFTSGQAPGTLITLFRDIAIERITQIGQNSGFSSTAFNAEYNNIYLILQQLADSIGFCLQVPNTNAGSPVTTLTPTSYANKYLFFDSNGNPQPASPITLVTPGAGAVLIGQTAAEATAGVVPTSTIYAVGNVLRYGADTTGVADSTTAINNALKVAPVVYLPAGTYKVTDALNFTAANQVVIGDALNTIVSVASSFNLSAKGVFVANALGSPDHGPWFENLRITCDQSQVASTGSRANLRLYPPALYLRGSPRWHVINCRIDQFTYGIDAQGSTPGGVIDDLEIGCYSCGLAIDGSGDTTRINNMHFIWFNEWTANQQAIISDGHTVGISAGRCDGLDVVDSLFFTPVKGISTFLGNGNNQVTDAVTGQSLANNGGSAWLTGFTTGQIDNCGFDTYGGVSQTGAGTWLLFSNCYFSSSVTSGTQVTQTDGEMRFNACRFSVSGGPPNPVCSIANSVAQTIHTTFNACSFQSNFDQSWVAVSGTQPVKINLTNCELIVAANATNANNLVSVTNSNAATCVSFLGNRATPKGSGTGTLLSIGTDGNHIVQGNDFSGWSLSMPAAYTKAIVANNATRGVAGLNASNAQYMHATNGGTTIGTAATVYLGPGAFQAAGNASNNFVFQNPGNVTGFTVKTDVNPGVGQTFTYTVYKNQVATSMTGSLTGAVNKLAVTTNSFAVAQDDDVTVQLVTSASAGVGNHKIAVMFEPA